MFKVKRPNGPNKRMNFPLIDWFVHTGEELNPYRCQACLTKPQRRAFPAMEVRNELNIVLAGQPRPECCRKCGCSF
jgi:hypothetical protein